MPKHIYSIVIIALVFGSIKCTFLYGETSVVESFGKKEKELSRKQFKQKDWSGEQQSNLKQKRISFKNWEMHYSSLGSKKWDTSVQKAGGKKRFKSAKMEFPTKDDMEFSQWQGYLVDLESKAQISTDSTVRLVQDKRVYEAMLQRAERYKDTGELLSLRDINRFQFRKNRSDKSVPVTEAGVGDDS